jgi:hypothetical protein
MNQRQLDDILMFNAVKLVLNNNQVVWNTNSVFADAVLTLQNNISGLNSQGQSQQTNIKGVTQTKEQAKDTLIGYAVALAYAGKAYAVATNNVALKQACTVTKSALVHTSETELPGVCQNLYDRVNPFIGSMNGYGVSAATQTILQAAITAFTALISTPRNIQTTSVVATATIALEIKNTKDLLDEQLDGLMEQYAVVSSAFYNSYHAARKLVSHGHHTKVVVEGVITKAGIAIAHAIVICMEDGDEHKKITAADGSFHFLLSPPANTIITVSLDGFADQTKAIVAEDLRLILLFKV